MGVPAFYRWLSSRFPKAIKPVLQDQGENVDGVDIPVAYSAPNPNGELDNLYLDMNGIVHPCTHPSNGPAPANEDEMMLEVFRYTEEVINLAKPRKLIMMAVDGVAPRAKMNQQRSRRFRSAKDAQIAEGEAIARAMQLPEGYDESAQKRQWDSNVITPGTEFMDFLAQCLQYWVAYKLNTDIGWKDLKIIISDASVPGEGEHKIMEFVRSQRNVKDYDHNTSHCIYGLDADLIFLGLATHEPKFRVMREDVFNQNKAAGKDKGHIWLDIEVLRQYLEVELYCEVPFYDPERAIDDWVFMAFFCGNDFLPHLPSLNVREDGINILLRSWRLAIMNGSMKGYMTQDGDVDLSRVQIMLKGVASREDAIFEQRHYQELRREQSRKYQQNLKKSRKPVDDLITESNVQLYTAKGEIINTNSGDGSKNTRGGDFEKAPTAKPDEKSNNDPEEESDEVLLWKPGYRKRYYTVKFHLADGESSDDLRRDMVSKYIEGVCWVLKYYYQGCASWTWFYPYHYAPFAQDMVECDVGTVKVEFPENTTPFRPFEQLMSVLPAASSHTLPAVLRDLMSNPDSPIIDFYPVDFAIDMNGSKLPWLGIALLPFIDEERLLSEVRKVYPQLSDYDKSRNSRGEPILLVSHASTIADELLKLYPSKSLSKDEAKDNESKELEDSDEVKKDEKDETKEVTKVMKNPELESVEFTCTQSKGLAGTAKPFAKWGPKRPLVCPIASGVEYKPIAPDTSIVVQFDMPENQKHKSMLLANYVEPELVLSPQDKDIIWRERRKLDQGNGRPDYRRIPQDDFSAKRHKRHGGYLAFLEGTTENTPKHVSPSSNFNDSRQGYGNGNGNGRYNQNSSSRGGYSAYGQNGHNNNGSNRNNGQGYQQNSYNNYRGSRNESSTSGYQNSNYNRGNGYSNQGYGNNQGYSDSRNYGNNQNHGYSNGYSGQGHSNYSAQPPNNGYSSYGSNNAPLGNNNSHDYQRFQGHQGYRHN